MTYIRKGGIKLTEHIEPPCVSARTTEEQIMQLKNYLCSLTQQLNYLIDRYEAERSTSGTRERNN